MRSMSAELSTKILPIYMYSILIFILTPSRYLSKPEATIKSELIHDTRLLNNYTITILITLSSLMMYSWGIIHDKFWFFHDVLYIQPSILSHLFILVIAWIVVYILSVGILISLSFAVHYICAYNLLKMVPVEYCFEQRDGNFVYIVANDKYREMFNKPESIWMYNLLTFYHRLALRFSIVVLTDS